MNIIDNYCQLKYDELKSNLIQSSKSDASYLATIIRNDPKLLQILKSDNIGSDIDFKFTINDRNKFRNITECTIPYIIELLSIEFPMLNISEITTNYNNRKIFSHNGYFTNEYHIEYNETIIIKAKLQ